MPALSSSLWLSLSYDLQLALFFRLNPTDPAQHNPNNRCPQHQPRGIHFVPEQEQRTGNHQHNCRHGTDGLLTPSATLGNLANRRAVNSTFLRSSPSSCNHHMTPSHFFFTLLFRVRPL